LHHQCGRTLLGRAWRLFAAAGERRAALKFVVHFIGDLHLPLHAATRVNPDTASDDRGGTEIKVAS
jgi:hypothetical protein